DDGVLLAAVRHALGDPADDQPIFVAVLLQLVAAAARDSRDALEEEQAVLGRRGEEAPAERLLDQVLVVVTGLEPEEREPEAVLAAALTVAAAAVAAELREDRRDLVREVDERRVDVVLDLHRDGRGRGACGGRHR